MRIQDHLQLRTVDLHNLFIQGHEEENNGRTGSRIIFESDTYHHGSILQCKFANDNACLVTCSNDATINVLDLRAFKLALKDAQSCHRDHDGDGDDDHQILLRDCCHQIECHDYTKQQLEEDSEENIETQQQLVAPHKGAAHEIKCVAFRDLILLYVGNGNKLQLFDLNTFQCIQAFTEHVETIDCVECCRDHENHMNMICTSSVDKGVLVWDIRQSKHVRTLYHTAPAAYNARVTDVQWLGSSHIAVAYDESAVLCWNAAQSGSHTNHHRNGIVWQSTFHSQACTSSNVYICCLVCIVCVQ